MEDEFVKKCEAAAGNLLDLADEGRDTWEAARLCGKAEGLRLAVSYLRDYPTADGALLAKVRAIVADTTPDPNDYGFTAEWAAFDSISELLAEGGAS